jgi:hypothetical protein
MPRTLGASGPVVSPLGPALAEAHAVGWGVIIQEAVANGRLTARNEEPALEPLREWARQSGASVDAVALERLRGLVESPDVYWAKRSALPWN